MKLISIKPSDKPSKKYVATFDDGKKVHFGAKGYSDFTIHKDEARKQRYINRHSSNESWNNPQTAGALSRWILWNKTSLRASIKDFKARFNL